MLNWKDTASVNLNPTRLDSMTCTVTSRNGSWLLTYDKAGYKPVDKDEVVTAEQAFWSSDKIFPRVARGGTFESSAEDCRSTARLFSTQEWNDEDPNLPQSPWWYTSDPSTGVGFRIMRPLKVPKDRAAMEATWVPKDKSLENACYRVDDSGRGAFGVVDEKLDDDISNQDK